MRVYRITYHEYEYNLTANGGDWHLTNTMHKHVMADNTLDAVDLLRSNLRSRIEVTCARL